MRPHRPPSLYSFSLLRPSHASSPKNRARIEIRIHDEAIQLPIRNRHTSPWDMHFLKRVLSPAKNTQDRPFILFFTVYRISKVSRHTKMRTVRRNRFHPTPRLDGCFFFSLFCLAVCLENILWQGHIMLSSASSSRGLLPLSESVSENSNLKRLEGEGGREPMVYKKEMPTGKPNTPNARTETECSGSCLQGSNFENYF